MTIEPNENVVVDGNTDDLDAFSNLMFGDTPKEPVKEVATETEVKEVAEEEETEVTTEISDQDEVEDADEDSDEDKPKKKPNGVQDRINKLLEKARVADEAAQKERTEKIALENRLKALEEKNTQPTNTQSVQSDDGPTPDDKNPDGSDKYPLGDFDPNYIRDLTRHTIQKEQTVAREEEAREKAERTMQESRDSLHAQWVGKVEGVTEKHEDFMEKTIELEETFDGLDPQYSDYLVQTIKSLDHGPEVLYYFANNLAEAQKFVKMGPLAATLALGEYNALFKGESVKKETKVSKAPPPPQVNKGSKVGISGGADTDDLDAFSKAFFKN